MPWLSSGRLDARDGRCSTTYPWGRARGTSSDRPGTHDTRVPIRVWHSTGESARRAGCRSAAVHEDEHEDCQRHQQRDQDDDPRPRPTAGARSPVPVRRPLPGHPAGGWIDGSCRPSRSGRSGGRHTAGSSGVRRTGGRRPGSGDRATARRGRGLPACTAGRTGGWPIGAHRRRDVDRMLRGTRGRRASVCYGRRRRVRNRIGTDRIASGQVGQCPPGSAEQFAGAAVTQGRVTGHPAGDHPIDRRRQVGERGQRGHLPFRCPATTSLTVPTNGARPARQLNSTQLSEYRSEDGRTGSPRRCSGEA